MRHTWLSSLHRFALIAALMPTAAAADWRYVTPVSTTPSSPGRFLIGADRAIWTFDDGTVSRSAGGTTVTLTRAMFGAADTDAPFDDGFALDGGDVILRNSACSLLRVDAHLRVKWRVDLAGCAGVDANASGTFWVARGVSLLQFGADGVQRQFIVVGRNVIGVEAQADGGVVAVSQNSTPPLSVVARYGSDGRRIWDYGFGAAVASPLAVAAADGGVYVASLLNSNIMLSRLSAQGALSWTTTHAVGSDSALAGIRRSSGDAVYVVTGTRTDAVQPRTLTRVNGNGQQHWQQALCNVPGTPEAAVALDIAVATDGSTANVCALQGIDRLVRRDTAGTVTATPALPLETSLQLGGAHDTLYVLGRETTASQPTALLAIDSANRIEPAAGVPAMAAPTRLRAHVMDSDDASYLLSKAEGIHGAALTKLDAQGRVIWRRTASSLELYDATLRVVGSRLCSTELAAHQAVPNGNNVLRARCWDTRDGSGGWERQAFLPFTRVMAHAPLANGKSVLVVAQTADYTIDLVEPSGATQQIGAGAGEVSQIGVADDGRSVLGVDTRLAQHAPDGNRVYLVPSPLSEYRTDFALTADGSVVVLGRRAALPTDRLSLWSVAPDGATRWIVELDAGFDRGRLVRGADAVYLLQYASLHADAAQSTSRITKFSATDGTRLWQQESHNPTPDSAVYDGGRLALAGGSGALLLAHAWPNKLRIERLDLQTGQRRDERFVDCNGACSPLYDLAPETTGGARIAFAALDRQSGASAAVVSTDALVTAAPPIALDQPGVAGLWFSPYANGEGLSIDWLPASRTLFGAWFTYTKAGGNDPAHQRWYTVQVNGVPENATTLELPILETTGGNFGTGPAVSPQAVGRATLTFRDCSTASLSYRFDAGHNESAAGTITLSRLTPLTQNCRRADGTLEPGSGARPPAKGFDARLSGAWYDDSAVGQGLQLNIQPDGVFFAPWFTYDPAGTQDDPGRQHWFTLQGDLAQAVDGRVDAQLVQTIGGAFDRVPTYNAYVVGSATLRVQGCDRATLDYRFADNTIAGPYAGRSGTLALKRMGDCAPAP